ncbi:MAG: LCP family protein [Defluviitaleaceae bacterium]|nr:LCP family protein [Defluviitaleaceae bacterium]
MRSLARAFKNSRLARKYFIIVGGIVVSFAVLSGAGLLAYMKVSANPRNPFESAEMPDQTPPLGQPAVAEASAAPSPAESSAISAGEQSAPPSQRPSASEAVSPSPSPSPTEKPVNKTTFLIAGEDNVATLTDVMLVVCLNRDTGEINVLSMPRDTRVTLSDGIMTTMRSLGLHPPSSGVCKLNAVRSYGGAKYGMQLLEQEIYEIIGVKIDYYAEVKLSAFRSIVDTLGGVDVTIPKGGLYYSDPEQNLLIAIPGGPQHLDGNMAEGLVRYRATYPGGDIDRIKVQQEFMKQLFSQVLQKNNLLKNAPSLLKTIIEDVKTNFGITEIPGMIPVISRFNADGISFYTLPGAPKYIGEASYWIADPSQFPDIVDKAFFLGNSLDNEGQQP